MCSSTFSFHLILPTISLGCSLYVKWEVWRKRNLNCVWSEPSPNFFSTSLLLWFNEQVHDCELFHFPRWSSSYWHRCLIIKVIWSHLKNLGNGKIITHNPTIRTYHGHIFFKYFFFYISFLILIQFLAVYILLPAFSLNVPFSPYFYIAFIMIIFPKENIIN